MKLTIECQCCKLVFDYDPYGGVDVSTLSAMQREIVMILVNEPDKSFSAKKLAERVLTSVGVVRNQVMAIRMAAGDMVIRNTPKGYKLGETRKQ